MKWNNVFFSFGHIKQQTTRIQQNKLIESILSKPNVHFSTFMKYLWPQFKKNTLWVLEIMMFLCLAIKLKDESNDGLNIKCDFCRNFAILTIIMRFWIKLYFLMLNVRFSYLVYDGNDWMLLFWLTYLFEKHAAWNNTKSCQQRWTIIWSIL